MILPCVYALIVARDVVSVDLKGLGEFTASRVRVFVGRSGAHRLRVEAVGRLREDWRRRVQGEGFGPKAGGFEKDGVRIEPLGKQGLLLTVGRSSGPADAFVADLTTSLAGTRVASVFRYEGSSAVFEFPSEGAAIRGLSRAAGMFSPPSGHPAVDASRSSKMFQSRVLLLRHKGGKEPHVVSLHVE